MIDGDPRTHRERRGRGHAGQRRRREPGRHMQCQIGGRQHHDPGHAQRVAGHHVGQPVHAQIEPRQADGDHHGRDHRQHGDAHAPRLPHAQQKGQEAVGHHAAGRVPARKRERLHAAVDAGRPRAREAVLEHQHAGSRANQRDGPIDGRRPRPAPRQPAEHRDPDRHRNARAAEFRDCGHRDIEPVLPALLQPCEHRLVDAYQRRFRGDRHREPDQQAPAGQQHRRRDRHQQDFGDLALQQLQHARPAVARPRVQRIVCDAAQRIEQPHRRMDQHQRDANEAKPQYRQHDEQQQAADQQAGRGLLEAQPGRPLGDQLVHRVLEPINPDLKFIFNSSMGRSRVFVFDRGNDRVIRAG